MNNLPFPIRKKESDFAYGIYYIISKFLVQHDILFSHFRSL